MSLEDPDDPNVVARGHRLRAAYSQYMNHAGFRFGGGAMVHLAQHEYKRTDGLNQMASEYVPTLSRDVATVDYLFDAMVAAGLQPSTP